MSRNRALQTGLLVLAMSGAWAAPASGAPAPAQRPTEPARPPAQTRPETARRPAPAPPAAAPAPAPDTAVPFRAGQTAVYSIAWRLFTAGEARMHIERAPNGRDWQGSINALSTGFVSKLYRVDDTITSTFDASGLCSRSVTKVINEGRRRRETRIDFERDRKLAVMRDIDPGSGQQVKQAEHPIPECAFDVVSALYYVRTLPLEVGRNFQLQLNDGGDTLPITVEVQAREDVKTDAGTFHAIRVEPRLTGGNLFRRGGRIQIWFTDDSQRLLVQMKARLFVGTISATLSQVEHR